MPKAIEVQEMSICCDAEGCGFSAPIKREDIKGYIGCPCPKCGSNLLTKKDYVLSLMLGLVVSLVNKLSGEVPESDGSTLVSVRTDTHGGFSLKRES